MLTVPRFNGIESAVFQARHLCVQPAWRALPEHGVGQADSRAKIGQKAYAFFRFQHFLGQIGLAVAAKILLENFTGIFGISLAQQDFSDMRSAHAFARGRGQHLFHGDVQPKLLKLAHYAFVTLRAFAPQKSQLFLQSYRIFRQPQPQDMQFSQFRARGNFAPAYEFDAMLAPGVSGFIQTRKRIMVSHGHDLKPHLGGLGHEKRRRIRAIGSSSVRMQINQFHEV